VSSSVRIFKCGLLSRRDGAVGVQLSIAGARELIRIGIYIEEGRGRQLETLYSQTSH
jgi:hypothetical protein